MPVGDAAVFCGYTISRVSILQSDPAFKELLTFYREDAQRPYRDLHIRLSGLASDASELLQERLELIWNLKSKSVRFRSVSLWSLEDGRGPHRFGPQATNLNVNVDLAGRPKPSQARRYA